MVETVVQVPLAVDENLTIQKNRFGSGKKRICIVTGTHGDEHEGQYVAWRLASIFKEKQHFLNGVVDIYPATNPLGISTMTRGIPLCDLDINRMFPGYEGGETTQRIAGRLFNALDGYAYGVHVTSIYLPGNIMPHLRVMETGYEDINEGLAFGLPYVLVRKPHPYDTTTLNYNWQIWNTCTFSLYTHETDVVDADAADEAVDAVVRFMVSKGWCDADVGSGYYSRILPENVLRDILSTRGGLLLRETEPGESVEEGQLLGKIIDPCSGLTAEELFAPCSGKLFFAHKAHLISGHEVAFRILPENE